MPYAHKIAGAWIEVPSTLPYVGANGIQHSPAIFTLWSDEERESIGLYEIEDDPIPEGRVAVGSTLEDVEGWPQRVWILEDAPPPPVPAEISDRQFAHALYKSNVISLAETKGFVKVGDLPAALGALIESFPKEQRDDAEIMLSGATTFNRYHPLTAGIAAAYGWSDEMLDDFWRFAASL